MLFHFFGKLRKAWFFLLLLKLLGPNLGAASYYVSNNGNDTNPGTWDQPWKSIAKVNQTTLQAGDSVYFQGGEQFIGNMVLKGGGSSQNPVLIGTYGATNAIIDSQANPGEPAIYGYNTGGFQIENLTLTNSGVGTNGDSLTNGYGIFFFADQKMPGKYPGIIMNNIEVAGNPATGISVGSWSPKNPGWDFVIVSNVYSHDNNEGMSTYGYTAAGVKPSYAIGELDVSASEFCSNSSSGLVICGARTGSVDSCSFHDNQSTGGCWTWGTAGITIQNCISHHNKKGDASDGFGFDLDGGSQDCTIQYCLSYSNDTPGFTIFDYPGSAQTVNNTIRYCVSENDVRNDGEWGSFEVFPYANTPIINCSIYNCVAYLTSRSGTNSASGFESYGRDLASWYLGGIKGCSFRNNVIYLDGAGTDMRFFTGNVGATQPAEMMMQGNLYYSSQGETAIYFQDRLYSNFEYWRLLNPEQEKLHGKRTGLVTNPYFGSVGTASSVTDPSMLASVTSYRPSAWSACLSHGLNLKKLFKINPGETDFWGNALPTNGPVTIGAF